MIFARFLRTTFYRTPQVAVSVSLLFSYKEARKNVLKISLLLLWVIFLFFMGLFDFLLNFSPLTWCPAHNVKNDVLTFRIEMDKRDNKSHTRRFTLSKQTFLYQFVTFLKQPVICGFNGNQNKETLVKKYSSGWLNVN